MRTNLASILKTAEATTPEMMAEQILRSSPEAIEICVERVKPLRFAEASGHYIDFFKKFNDTITAARS